MPLTLFAPPDARRSKRSTPAMFIVPAPTNLSRFPLAENSNFSAAFEPLKMTRSLPAPPSIRSLPRLPSIVSLPIPANSRSAAEPLRSRSLPVSPKRLVASLPVNTPKRSSIEIASAPAAPCTTIRLKAERLKVNSAEPLPPTSTWRRDLLPGFSRSVILLFFAVPRTLSRPRRMPASTFGFVFVGFVFAAFVGGGLAAGAPYAEDDDERMMTAATNTGRAAARTIAPRRPTPSRLMNSNADRTYSSLIAMPDWLVSNEDGDGGPAFTPWRPPCLFAVVVERARRQSCSTSEPDAMPRLERRRRARQEARLARRPATCGRRS